MAEQVIGRSTIAAIVLKWPLDRLALRGREVDIYVKDVVDAARCIIRNGGRERPFQTQADVVAYAGNELGWGTGGGYTTI